MRLCHKCHWQSLTCIEHSFSESAPRGMARAWISYVPYIIDKDWLFSTISVCWRWLHLTNDVLKTFSIVFYFVLVHACFLTSQWNKVFRLWRWKSTNIILISDIYFICESYKIPHVQLTFHPKKCLFSP